MTTKPTPARTRKSPATRKTITKAPTNAATGATGRTTLGTFTPNGKDSEKHLCTGACGLLLPIKKFPTPKTRGVRVSECRSCRDTRTKATRATNGRDGK
ncbi:hypothetical protein GHK92_03025 [Nocardioides sp. dk4132]|uniref:hypothetical protein n=1 Tax=unclassified Nocardioides TaxID=2615069 RepID=UPI001295C4C3|nr:MULTISPECIES: hypothetical protein [unclassified Nocardioides]MQW74834.1 hypothetical protein [Nocardioides sp. dk4132]QGA06722.1 hypothetical protein GFH29_04465 [Nocardioides sp. dk884]